jgi:tRNA A58 N-methylase Trm61
MNKGNAKEYVKSKNDYYPHEFIRYLYEQVGITKGSSIADIGSGTGKLSNQLLLQGNKVYWVEPYHAMRKTAEKNLLEFQNYVSINGTAEHTSDRRYHSN